LNNVENRWFSLRVQRLNTVKPQRNEYRSKSFFRMSISRRNRTRVLSVNKNLSELSVGLVETVRRRFDREQSDFEAYFVVRRRLFIIAKGRNNANQIAACTYLNMRASSIKYMATELAKSWSRRELFIMTFRVTSYKLPKRINVIRSG